MAVNPTVVASETLGNAPGSVTLPDGFAIDLRCVNATWNGASASGRFTPTVDIVAASGQLIGRFVCQQSFEVGDSGEVTFAPFLEQMATTISTRAIGAGVFRPQASPQSVPSSVSFDTTITWTSVTFDTAGMWNAGNPTRLTANAPGLYLFTATGGFVANPTGDRAAGIFKNGTTELIAAQLPTSSVYFWGGSMSVVSQLVAGDYVELKVAQNCGVNLNTADSWLTAIGFSG